VKYGNWVKNQVIAPIDEIYLLLQQNHAILSASLISIDAQIHDTKTPSLQKPLILQKDRIDMQLDSFERVMKMLEGYRKKLS
jgi:hypothetical protein